jgi:hypothetical protein
MKLELQLQTLADRRKIKKTPVLIWLICAQCQKDYAVTTSQFYPGRRFCSRTCYRDARNQTYAEQGA